jgi:hypothetical protein
MGIHENFIGGNWTEASTAAPNVNSSNIRDIVGEYARGTRDDANRAIEMAQVSSLVAVEPAGALRGAQKDLG